ncbi:hypothetical protein TR2A62_1024 [Thalassobium sp. R2A62]|nr:hypothetical protein TR2A62_1024 [Thalassobium sp. R2A62]
MAIFSDDDLIHWAIQNGTAGKDKLKTDSGLASDRKS